MNINQPNMKPFIIAEIGVNHNNNINYAKKIIDFCSKEKIDAVKFQTFSAEKLALKNTSKVKYQKKNTQDRENHFQMLSKLELSKEDHVKLKKYCEKKNIEFISTPYDVESAKFLLNLKIKTFKVASADLTDHYLHEFLAKTKKKIIISTGMSHLAEIKNTLNIYRNISKKKISLLHCVSNYPCSDKSLNLNSIDLLLKFGFEVGFSDHTKDSFPSALAIAKGAKIIEKHITLDNNLPGPDHKASLNLRDFRLFLKDLERTYVILGKNKKTPQKEEREMRKISRKSLYYKSKFFKGKKIDKNDLIPLRPNKGVCTSRYKEVINRKLKKNVNKHEAVDFNKLF